LLYSLTLQNIGKIISIVKLENIDKDKFDSIGKKIAMHIAASNPLAIDKDGIEKKIVDKELEIKISNAEKTISENKKEQMDQITDEMINITKITVTKIANINVSEEDISKALNATKAEVN